MTPLRFSFDPVRSCVWIDARSNLHPINTETRGLQGWIEVTVGADRALDLSVPVRGRLELSVEQLSSGNQLYDRELKRRIDARRYPLIEGEVVSLTESGPRGSYLVSGDLTFHGTTRRFTHEMTITLPDGGIELKGERDFDIRQFGMKPPSMLMLRVYPEVVVRVELYGTADT